MRAVLGVSREKGRMWGEVMCWLAQVEGVIKSSERVAMPHCSNSANDCSNSANGVIIMIEKRDRPKKGRCWRALQFSAPVGCHGVER